MVCRDAVVSIQLRLIGAH